MKQTLQWLSAFKMSSHFAAGGKSARMLMRGRISPHCCRREFSLNNIYHNRSETRTTSTDCVPFLLGLEMLPEIRLVLIVLGFLFQPPFLIVFWVKHYRENSSLNKEGCSLAMVFRKDNFSNQDYSYPLSRFIVVLKERNSWRVSPVITSREEYSWYMEWT